MESNPRIKAMHEHETRPDAYGEERLCIASSPFVYLNLAWKRAVPDS